MQPERRSYPNKRCTCAHAAWCDRYHGAERRVYHDSITPQQQALFDEYDKLFEQWLAEGRPINGYAFTRTSEIFQQLVKVA